jgi:hypothetical protein
MRDFDQMPAPINVGRHYRICACNCSGTCCFFQRSFRHSVACRQRDRRPRRRLTKQRDKAMRLTPFARTSFSSSLCGASFGAQSPSMHRHRSVKVNFVFDHILSSVAYSDRATLRDAMRRSLSGEKQTLRDNRKSVAYDPYRTRCLQSDKWSI